MRHGDGWWRTGNTKPMADRQIDQLIGLAQGILADGIVNQAEAEVLQSWLRLNHRTDNPYVSRLLDQVERVLADGVLDEDEGRELHDALMSWTGGGGTDGEESTTASLPLDPDPRTVRIAGNIFVFTGTGVFGTRKMMQDATIRAGGTVERSITMRTNFVVLGTYVTPAWVHQSFGRKIEKAMDYRDRKGTGVQIVHEEDWAQALEL
ncbi:MAG: BRCT domain-containing protein [Chloroflexota bacterium]|nr:BRCT domain-containing protein [Chloroflexota bacterium]